MVNVRAGEEFVARNSDWDSDSGFGNTNPHRIPVSDSRATPWSFSCAWVRRTTGRPRTFQAPVLGYSIDDDPEATKASVDAMMAAYPNAERRYLTRDDASLVDNATSSRTGSRR